MGDTGAASSDGVELDMHSSEGGTVDEAALHSEPDASLMMRTLSEKMVALKSEHLEVGWSVAPFPQAAAREGTDVQHPGWAPCCFTSDIETVFNAQMTATRVAVWTWAFGGLGTIAALLGVGGCIDSTFSTNFGGTPSMYEWETILLVGVVQLAACFGGFYYADYLVNWHSVVEYFTECVILLYVFQNFWAGYLYYYTKDEGPSMSQSTRHIGFMCLMPFAISFLMGSRFSIVVCISGNVAIILGSEHSSFANDFWVIAGHGMILTFTYFALRGQREGFIKNLELLIFQNLEKVSLKQRLELDAAEKMRAYQKVVAATAHDLRTASAALLSGCTVLKTLGNFAQARGEERKKELSVIVNMSAMANFCSQFLEGMTLSSRLLDGSAVPIRLERIDVRELIEESIAVARLACSGSNSVDHGSTLPQDLSPFVYSDSLCLSRNLLNFLSNASKHTRKGSINVNITLHHPTKYDPNEPAMIEFAVCDTGNKVPEQAKSSIFKPFVSMDGSTGLGLFVVKFQSDALGGSCGVRDNPTESGSEFWFRIPYLTSEEQMKEHQQRMQSSSVTHMAYDLSPGAKKVFVEGAENEEERKRVSSSSPGNNDDRTILLIDDTSSLLDLVCEELAHSGYSVTKGLGAQDGLELMKARTYSLVLIDIKMPYQNGDEIVAGFRHWEKFNRSKEQLQTIYAVTSYTSDEVQRRCQESGMSGVIRKPLQVHMLAGLTQNLPTQDTCL